MGEQLTFELKNQQLIKWARRFMICSGVWRLPVSENRILQLLFNLYAIFMQITYAVFFLMLFGETLRLIIYKYEVPIIIATTGVLCNAIKIFMKIVVYVKYSLFDIFKEIIEKEKYIWELADPEIIKMYQRKIKVNNLYGTSLAVTTLMTIIILQSTGSMAVLKIAEMNKRNNETIEAHLMYQTLFPLNRLNHLKMFFASQVLWSWSGITYNTMTQMVYLSLLTYVTTQLKVLQIQLRNFVKENFGKDEDMERKEDYINVLTGLIIRHQEIINFVKFINKATKYTVMVEYFLSSMDIASVSVNIIQVSSQQAVWLLFFLTLLVLQVSLIAWTCNEIKIESVAIGDAIYESKWYLLEKDAKDLTKFVIARTQVPLIMTIGPFGAMTTGSALTIFKAAYSYINIMKK